MTQRAWKGFVMVKDILSVEAVPEDVYRRKLCFRIASGARCV